MLRRATADDWRDILPAQLISASAPDAEAPISLRHYRFDENAVIELPGITELTLCFAVGRPAVLEHRIHGRWLRRTYRPGEAWIIPAGAPVSSRVVGSALIAHLYLSDKWFDDAAAEEFGPAARRVCLTERPRVRDAFLWVLAAGLLRRIRVGQALDRMVLDALALGLACHLVRAHSSVEATRVHANSAHRERDRPLVSDFIDEIVVGEVGLDEFADAIGVAKHEMTACFVDGDAERLRAHIENRKIRRARACLQASRNPLRHVARDLGFKSPAALDTALYFACGCTAAEFRELATQH